MPNLPTETHTPCGYRDLLSHNALVLVDSCTVYSIPVLLARFSAVTTVLEAMSDVHPAHLTHAFGEYPFTTRQFDLQRSFNAR